MAATDRPTLLLVHGGGHSDPAYLATFRGLLHRAGFETESGSQPSDGNIPAPGRAMYDDALYWRAKIEALVNAGKDVVLFMHSIGSVAGTEAAQGLTKKDRMAKGLTGGVVCMIFLAAYLAAEGESIFTFYGEGSPQPSRAEFITENGVTFADLRPFYTHYYNDLPEDQRLHWASMMKRVPAEWYGQPVTHATWKDVPCTWILTQRDEIVLPEVQRKMLSDAEERHGVKISVVQLDSSHSPFLSMPEQLVEIVVQAVCGHALLASRPEEYVSWLQGLTEAGYYLNATMSYSKWFGEHPGL